jgi:hypothetical protein
LHLKLLIFFQPAGFFTEMLRFDKKNCEISAKSPCNS